VRVGKLVHHRGAEEEEKRGIGKEEKKEL